MKDSKTILNGHLFLSIALQALIVVLLALPPLEPWREKASELTTLPSTAFWIPLLGLMLVANVLIFRRVGKHFVEPFQSLYGQTKLGSSSIAFKKKSMNLEEDHLKHFIESQSLKSADLELEVGRMESEVERISQLANVSPDEIDALRAELKAAAVEKESVANKLISEQANAANLQKEIVTLRRELKQHKHELLTLQSETQQNAETTQENPLSSILVERLKTPLSLINNLAWRLAKSWADTPPAQIREGLEEITRHSEEQLELLKQYDSKSGNTGERKAL